MKKYCIAIICVLFSINMIAQTQTGFEQKLVIETIDAHLLHEAILSEVNHYRDSLKLPVLEVDEILEKSALLHVIFVSKSDKLTHIQSNKKLKTPLDRVVFYDGDHELVDENISSIQIGAKDEFTYHEIAISFLKSSIKGKAQSKILTNNNFFKTGIQVVLKSNKIYIVQVFCSMPLNIAGLHSPANAYGIGNYRAKDCKTCLEGLDTLYKTQYKFGVMEENGMALFHFSDVEMFKKIFSSGKYYFSADLILKQQFQKIYKQ